MACPSEKPQTANLIDKTANLIGKTANRNGTERAVWLAVMSIKAPRTGHGICGKQAKKIPCATVDSSSAGLIACNSGQDAIQVFFAVIEWSPI